MPITSITVFIMSFAFWVCWLALHHRINVAQDAPSKQVLLMHNFFLWMAVFVTFVSLPHLWLEFKPSQFPLAMALGYTIGNIFLFLSFINLIRLILSMIPKISRMLGQLLITLGVLAGIALTVISTITMVFGVRPEYSASHGVTILNVHPLLGISLAVFAVLTLLPVATLFIINGVRNPSKRIRSFLLGGGFLTIAVVGAVYNNTNSVTLYVLADIFTIIAALSLLSGVMYRFEERLVIAKSSNKLQESASRN